MKKIKPVYTFFFLLGTFTLIGQVDPDVIATGKSIYRHYCAPCHGLDGSGGGPIAMYLNIPPANLTQIAARRDGVFPEEEIHRIIDGRMEARAHGTIEMPIWGDAFRRTDSSDPEIATKKIQKLVIYLKTIQERE